MNAIVETGCYICGVVVSMGSYVPEFMVCQLRYLNESTHDIKTLKHLYFDVITDVFIVVHRLSTSCNLVSYMLLTTIASFTAVTLNVGERHMMVSSFPSPCKHNTLSYYCIMLVQGLFQSADDYALRLDMVTKKLLSRT